jgi:LmbE family N-acetylglucosaminyl deacetylase
LIRLSAATEDVKLVLCLGAHCDDIEIGCGGTVMALAERYPRARFRWVVFSGDDRREAETRAAASRLYPSPEMVDVEVHRFRDSFFPDEFAAIKETVGRLGQSLQPDIVFTHRGEDRHQDHRLLSELTWNTFRNHLILEYEIPKYDGDLGQPNVYVPLSEEQGRRKIAALLESFPTQKNKPWFTDSVFQGLLSIRGMECRSPSGLAEGFHARKLTL